MKGSDPHESPQSLAELLELDESDGVTAPISSSVARYAPRPADAASEAGAILRFQATERMVHWAIAVPFLICFVTAMLLFLVYNPHPQWPLRAALSWTHRISGICLFLLPAAAMLRGRRNFRVHVENVRQAWTWVWSDFKWLALMLPAAISDRIALPEQGKFNAAEKINFLMVMTTYPLYIVTGLMIWLPGIAFYSWQLHVWMALAATPMLLGHIFMATVNRDTRVGLSGMISGYVDRRWAKHHYRRWYRENFEQGVYDDQTGEHLAADAQRPTPIECGSCRAERLFVPWERLVRSVFEATPLPCPGCGVELEAIAATVMERPLAAVLRELEQRSMSRSSGRRA